MAIDIEVTPFGWDKVINDLESIPKWAEIIEKTAKELCNDPDCKRIKFKFIDPRISCNASDIDALDCIITAIRKHLPDMTPTAKKLYAKMLQQLESEKAKRQSTS